MSEQTSNAISLAVPAPAKTSGTTGRTSTLTGESTSQNTSSFSSKLSDAEDRQRARDTSANQSDTRARGDSKTSATESSVSHSADRDSTANTSSATESEPADAPQFDTLAVEQVKRDAVTADLTGGENPIDHTGRIVPLVADDENGLTKTQLAQNALAVNSISDSAVDNPVVTEILSTQGGDEKSQLHADELSIAGLPGSEGRGIGGANADETKVDNTGLVAASSTVPVAQSATGTATRLLPTDASLQLNSATTATLLAESAQLSVSPAKPGENALAERLGRLPATLESVLGKQTKPKLAQEQTENSLTDTSVASLLNRALGSDADQALHKAHQTPVTDVFAVKGEQSKGLLLSDFALPRQISLAVKDAKAGIGRNDSPNLLLDGQALDTPELELAQLAARLSQSTSRGESLFGDALKGASAMEQMLAASTGGTGSAANLGRFDLGNAVNVNAPAPVPSSVPVPAPLNVPLLSSSASEVLSGNIRWMVGEGIQNATISVTPSGMGPITVQIGMEKDQMNISIVASQASTREAIETSIPRLREQLGTQGLESVRVDVSDGRSDQSKSNAGTDRQATGGNAQDAQYQNGDNNKDDNSSARFANSNDAGSGERVLSDAERTQLSRLQALSSDPAVTQSTISHGYDLYV